MLKNKNSINWDLFRIFLCLAETGSIVRAARLMNVSEPTVARKLDLLENSLGVPLFYRGVKGVSLTREGIELSRQIGSVEETISDATSSITTPNNQLREVTISATPGLVDFWLCHKLPQIAVDHPDLQLRVMSSYKLHDLVEAGVDIVIRVGDPGDLDLVGVNVGKMTFGIYATEAFIEAHDFHEVTIEKLRNTPTATPPFWTPTFSNNIDELTSFQMLSQTRNQILSESIHVQMAAVEAGTHCGCLPVAFCKNLNARRVSHKASPFEFSTDIWLLRRSESRLRPGSLRVFDALKSELFRSADLFLGEDS